MIHHNRKQSTERAAAYQKMINSSRWVTLRSVILADHPFCQNCKEKGVLKVATEVHHVRPVEDGLTQTDMQRLMFNEQNLRALCHDCHVAAHQDLGRSGRKRNERVTKEYLNQIIERFPI